MNSYTVIWRKGKSRNSELKMSTLSSYNVKAVQACTWTAFNVTVLYWPQREKEVSYILLWIPLMWAPSRYHLQFKYISIIYESVPCTGVTLPPYFDTHFRTLLNPYPWNLPWRCIFSFHRCNCFECDKIVFRFLFVKVYWYIVSPLGVQCRLR